MKYLFNHIPVLVWILLAIVLLETLSSTYIIYYSKPHLLLYSALYELCGLAICILPMFLWRPTKTALAPPYLSVINKVLLWGGMVFIGAFIIYQAIQGVMTQPLNVYFSDILPTIEALCKRFIKGETIYAPIQELWNGVLPNYLPTMWMPFVPLVLYDIDMRWLPVITFAVSIIIITVFHTRVSKSNPILIAVGLISLFILVNFLIVKQRLFFHYTQEGMIVFFYLLLAYGLERKKIWITAIAITLCLLSRYTLFFWIPAYLLFEYFQGSKKRAYWITGIVSGLVSIIFIIPYFIKQPEFFINIPANYYHGMYRAWEGRESNNNHMLGLIEFLSKNQLPLLLILQKVFIIAIPFSALLAFLWLKKRFNLNKRFWTICSLKLTLVAFYFVLPIPFYYLFVVSTILSYAIIFNCIRYLGEPEGSVIS